jgi:hypothetical protein
VEKIKDEITRCFGKVNVGKDTTCRRPQFRKLPLVPPKPGKQGGNAMGQLDLF